VEKFENRANNTTSFVCYQRLEDNVAFIQRYGMKEFEKQQETKRNCLGQFLRNSRRTLKIFLLHSCNCLEIGELDGVLENAQEKSKGLYIKAKSEVMHSLLNEIADDRRYLLKLRK